MLESSYCTVPLNLIFPAIIPNHLHKKGAEFFGFDFADAMYIQKMFAGLREIGRQLHQGFVRKDDKRGYAGFISQIFAGLAQDFK